MAAVVPRSISLTPNQPETFDEKHDFLVVNTPVYKVKQYLDLIQLCTPTVQLTDPNRIMFASTFLTGTAAVWWYTIVQANEVPTNWIDFKKAIVTEFVPEDHFRWSQERLHKLKQTTSVAKFYLTFETLC